jgi:predicted phage terminase large subunit-like protein
LKTRYSHAIPIEHNLAPGPLWEYKHTAAELAALEKADVYNYSAQYLQDPHKKGGTIFQTEWWQYYDILPAYEWKAVFGDTALKDGEENDWTVFQCWAKYRGRIYLVDQARKKIKATDLEQLFIEFWNKHKGSIPQPNRGAYIEDKSSGIQLIQDIQKKGGIPIIGIPREKSKVFRANNLVNWIKSELLYLPRNAEWLYDYKNEFERFSPVNTHKHDDQIDPTLDAIENMLIIGGEMKAEETQPKKKSIAPTKTAQVW